MPIAPHTPTSALPALLLRSTWLTALALLSACVTIPVTKGECLSLALDELMHPVEEQAYQTKKAEAPASGSPQDAEMVRRVATRLIQASAVDLPWEVTLFEEPGSVNAFCPPAGQIGVYTGFISLAQNEAGLATIIGHEMGHTVARHGSEHLTHEFAQKIALSLLAISLQNDPKRAIILRSLAIAPGMRVRAYNREQESEADRIALEYMSRAGYAPSEAVALWRRMAEQQETAQGSLAVALDLLFSTHPNPLERAQLLEEWLPLTPPLHK